MLAVLIGCGLRRAEAAALRVEDLQLREEHWVIADLHGKGGQFQTVPVPDCVKAAIDHRAIPACVTSGALFRSINKAGRVWGDGFTLKVIWSMIKQAASNCFLSAVTPTIFGEPEQIQFLLGHVSIQTPERYLGCKQRLQNAVNDHPLLHEPTG